MKSLALGAVLFCGLAAILGYVATNGVGMRSTAFSPTVVENLPTLPQKISAPPPDVVIEAKPINRVRPAKAVAANKPKPKTALVQNRPNSVVAARTQPPQVISESRGDGVKQAVTLQPPQPAKHVPAKPKAVERRAVSTQSLQITVQPQPPTDESQDMQRDLDAQREWRARTLERWREQEREAAAGRRDSGEAQTDHSLDSTPVGGLDKADDDKKSKKKKRHRFLFIRW